MARRAKVIDASETPGQVAGKAVSSEAAPLLWGELGIGLLYSLLGYALFTLFEIEDGMRYTVSQPPPSRPVAESGEYSLSMQNSARCVLPVRSTRK